MRDIKDLILKTKTIEIDFNRSNLFSIGEKGSLTLLDFSSTEEMEKYANKLPEISEHIIVKIIEDKKTYFVATNVFDAVFQEIENDLKILSVNYHSIKMESREPNISAFEEELKSHFISGETKKLAS